MLRLKLRPFHVQGCRPAAVAIVHGSGGASVYIDAEHWCLGVSLRLDILPGLRFGSIARCRIDRRCGIVLAQNKGGNENDNEVCVSQPFHDSALDFPKVSCLHSTTIAAAMLGNVTRAEPANFHKKIRASRGKQEKSKR